MVHSSTSHEDFGSNWIGFYWNHLFDSCMLETNKGIEDIEYFLDFMFK
jgi:hypothetical protein